MIKAKPCALILMFSCAISANGTEERPVDDFFSLQAELIERTALYEEVSDLSRSEQAEALSQWRQDRREDIRRLG